MGLSYGGDIPTSMRPIKMSGTTIVPDGVEQNFIWGTYPEEIWDEGQSTK